MREAHFYHEIAQIKLPEIDIGINLYVWKHGNFLIRR